MLRIAVGVILLVAFYVFFAEEMFFVKIPIPEEKKHRNPKFVYICDVYLGLSF
jgi:hypothetical protein